MTTINWAALRQTADDATKPLPDGDYNVVVTKATAANAATSGNPMIKIMLEVEDGPKSGRSLFHNLNLTPDSGFALNIFFRALTAFGLSDQYFEQNPTIEQIASDIVGRRACATVGTRTWQGQERNDVKNLTAATGDAAALATGIPSTTTPVASNTVPSATTPPTTSKSAPTTDMPKPTNMPPLPY